ncbi:hypothetical protein [Flavobacterium panici]|uniref:Uncharacterized protein n=1 Tax=Flavobacterium panici TaxID=2654843 RepID=A0A9N8P1I2_9FLAO|nr:hypothetical protein [Flavobacterium panici]CAC9974104.1 hypothetical protein FLAPXU55_01797 [Flavobacterium panici]
MITITRVYSHTNGESHFEDFEVPLKNNGDIGFLSNDEPVKSIVLEKSNLLMTMIFTMRQTVNT